MATRDGGGVGGFIQNLLALQQLNLQGQAERRAQARQRGEMVAVYQNLIANTRNPELAAGLRKSFAPLTGRTEDELLDLAELTVPNLATQQAGAVERGLASMGEGERTAVEQAAATTGLSGLSPFDVARGEAYSMLPIDERIQGMGVAQGTRLSAGQQQQALQFIQSLNEQIRQFDQDGQIKWANNRLGWATLMQQGALAMLGLEIDQRKASESNQDVSFSNILDLINAYGTAQRHFQEQKGKMSEDELQAQLNYLRGLEAQLINFGVIPGRRNQATDPRTGAAIPDSTVLSPVTPVNPGGVSLPSPIPFVDYLRGRR